MTSSTKGSAGCRCALKSNSICILPSLGGALARVDKWYPFATYSSRWWLVTSLLSTVVHPQFNDTPNSFNLTSPVVIFNVVCSPMDYWIGRKAKQGGALILLVTLLLAVFPSTAAAPVIIKSSQSNLPTVTTSTPEWAEYQYLLKSQYSKELAHLHTKKKPATPAPSASRKVAQVSPGVEQWRSIVAQYDWPVNIALAIMRCESGGNPTAVSPTNDHGLFQINKGLQIYGEQIYDPAFNVKVAYEKKYKTKQSWNHWTVYKNGCYLQYL